ncbi:ROK family transcriptional regulator [Curtobacterium sp. MCBD17_035]|uniref:ROK family transcriptional regulator n=1 Tax=Curtobacterium sp. MCBD17_035 TaxID=2175673 RepID=UPI000DA75839|nr:ROK family transcriptional regulator [Curtobacterium sp. MCBD17_035]WIB68320.1 ROK family transcriptional regulator [Curtobacterium sp. MCBD17_035]
MVTVRPDAPIRRLKGASVAETRSAIVDLIRSSGTISRTELAERSGLTNATISKIVRTLLDDGLVSEVGYAESTGGKRAVLLELNSTAGYAVGVALDTAQDVYVLVDLSGRPIDARSVAGTGTESPEAVVARVARDVAVMLADHGIDRDTVIGIGVAGEGRLDLPGRVLRSTDSWSEWDDFALGHALTAATDLPVTVDNDANCAALGEFWSGRVPSTRDFATVYMATGIGCGLLVGGDVHRGASSNAGEIGHMSLRWDGPPCWCGSRGCLEVLAAPAAVVARARTDAALVARLGIDTTTDGDDARAVTADVRATFARVAAAAVQGDTGALALVEESAEYLARAILNLVNLLDLDEVYLAGPGFATAGVRYLRAVQRELHAHAVMRGTHPVHVAMSAVGRDAAALGAAAAVLHARLTRTRAGRG